MPEPYRLPINCSLTGNSYVLPITLGSGSVPLSLIVDTGSSTAAVDAASYDPEADVHAITGLLLQNTSYFDGNILAAVVQSSVTLSPAATFPATNFAVNYGGTADVFSGAHGILGLGYKTGNSAYTMPGNTWQNRYPSVPATAAAQTIDPFLDQHAADGTLACAFAIGVKRALRSQASADPAADPLNSGILVLGGGADCTDLYQGTPNYVQLVTSNTYNTTLISVQVGNQPPIAVPAPPSWSSAISNAFINSGTPNLTLAQTLYNSVLASFSAISPAFGTTLTSGTCDQTTLDLGAWPSLTLTLQGETGSPVTLTVPPANYWQFDAQGKGQAVATIVGDGGALGGESVLGLPVFAGNFVLFDRTVAEGPGRVGFAPLR